MQCWYWPISGQHGDVIHTTYKTVDRDHPLEQTAHTDENLLWILVNLLKYLRRHYCTVKCIGECYGGTWGYCLKLDWKPFLLMDSWHHLEGWYITWNSPHHTLTYTTTFIRIHTHTQTRVDLAGLDLMQVDLVRVGHRYEPTNTLLLTLVWWLN